MKNKIFLGIVAIFVATLTQAQWTPDPFCPYPSDEVTRYPYYGNCSLWWECFEGTKYPMECPEGLEFNAPLEQCDDPSIAHCDPFASTTSNPNRTTISTTRTTPGGQGPDCSGVGESPEYYPYEGDCSKYWECWRGNGYLFSCPAGLWWDPTQGKCTDPGDFCQDFTTETPTTTTSHGLPDCTGVTDPPVYYPYPGDCTKYFECANGELYLQSCPSGLWWDQSSEECENPGPFCDNSTIVTTVPTVPTVGDMCTGGSDDLPFYPFPDDCTKYFECSNGFLYLYSCPSGSWWNQGTSQCEPPGDFCSSSTPSSTSSTPFQCSADGTSYWPHPNYCQMYIECIDGTGYEVDCPEGLYFSDSQKICVSEEESECCLQQSC